MVKPVPLLVSILLSTALPSCFIYDESLLLGDSDDSGNPSTGGGPQSGGASSGGAASGGGDPGSGGGDPGSGGGDPGSGGGSSGSGGQGPGSGGTPGVCDPATGEKGPNSSVSGVTSTTLIDDFDTDWTYLGTDSPYRDGAWFVSKEPSVMDLHPDNGDAIDRYAQDPCLDAGDLSLHVTATGDPEATWAFSYDAGFRNSSHAPTPVNLSEYAGVVFWARSSENNQITVRFTQEDGSGSVAGSPLPALTGQWKAYKVTFPSSDLDKTKVLTIHLDLKPAAKYDLWIDDFELYK